MKGWILERGFTLTSTDLVEGAQIDLKHVDTSAGGDNQSPHLAWSGFPAGTQSFAVTCYDPDAPTAAGYWHWAVVDLPVAVTELERGAGTSDESLPGGFHLRTDAGTPAYSGSAPPKGDHPHRYIFVVHAVDVPMLGIDASVTPTVLGFNLAFHTLARARITVTFGY